MSVLKAVNRKAQKIESSLASLKEDVQALQKKGGEGKIYYPMGCTLNFTPGWEVDASGGTAGLCQPVERDLFDCYLGCGWPAQVPDHLNNAVDWTDKCASAANDWRKVDIVFPVDRRYKDTRMRRLALFTLTLAMCGQIRAQMASSGQLMYIGTLDKKLLVLDETKEEVVDQIALDGIPRVTCLSADHKKLYVITTQMVLEVVDLESRKMLSSFSLTDSRSRPRIQASAPDRINVGASSRYSGLAVDPQGRYLYTTMRVVERDIDQYHIEPPQFVAIDLQEKKVAKAWPFPKDLDQGFGFDATYKVSSDGKLLYVFQDDILVFDLATFKQVDKIELAHPPYPGSSPYRLAANEDTFDSPDTVTSVFTSVDPIVHKGTLGMATIDLPTHKVNFFPIGPLLPMMGFMVSPDHKLGYSVMPKISTGGNRLTEWWVWDIQNHKVIKTKEFESRPTFKFAVGGDGTKLYMYGAGSTLEIFDAKTLESRKLIYLNKDTTTNLITIASR